jgi:hypothetical protein
MALAFGCVSVAAGRELSGFAAFTEHSTDGLPSGEKHIATHRYLTFQRRARALPLQTLPTMSLFQIVSH